MCSSWVDALCRKTVDFPHEHVQSGKVLLERRPRWRVIRHEIAAGDKPHHVATHVLRKLHISSPAVPVEAIATALEVTVIRKPTLDVAGVLRSTRTEATICVKSSESPVRQRFTIAHELGHLLLHAIGVQFRDHFFGPSGDWKETQANEFAAGLLMPLWMLEPFVGGGRRSGQELAEKFGVSSAAINVQLKKLL